MSAATRPAVALIHGGFVDGSGWRGVYDRLRAMGHRVAVVQNPTVSLEGDVTATKRVLDELDSPVVLVGRSYGGVVVTETGTDPRVAGLVYVAAFAPDKGESVNTLIADPPLRFRRSCHPGTDTCSSTATSSTILSPATCPQTRPRSWPIPRCRGGQCARRHGQRPRLAVQAELVPRRKR